MTGCLPAAPIPAQAASPLTTGVIRRTERDGFAFAIGPDAGSEKSGRGIGTGFTRDVAGLESTNLRTAASIPAEIGLKLRLIQTGEVQSLTEAALLASAIQDIDALKVTVARDMRRGEFDCFFKF